VVPLKTSAEARDNIPKITSENVDHLTWHYVWTKVVTKKALELKSRHHSQPAQTATDNKPKIPSENVYHLKQH
jgi:hypothetical protein